MSAMSFLATLGSYLAKGIALLSGLGPLMAPWLGSSGAKEQTVVATAVNDLTSIGQVVIQAEALIQTSGSGAAKLSAATPLVAQIVKTSELVSGHNISNDALFTQGCSSITSGVADILNSLSNANVKSTNNPVIAPAPAATETPAA